MNLSGREWKEFRIYDVFLHKRGKRQVESSRNKGFIPYYSASKDNNGLTDFISNPTFIIDKNAIIYSTFGDAYYVEKQFSTSDEITILQNPFLNKYNGIFISRCINQNKSKYSFGRKAFSNKISKDNILLPVTRECIDKPDWDFMEAYIKEKYIKKEEEYKNYVNTVLKEIEYQEVEPLEKKEWNNFKICDVCFIYSGKDIYERERINGITPYITSSAQNNGIKYLVSNNNETLEENAISVNRNGSVGYAFYHKYKALYSNDCRKLKLKENDNEYVALFLTNQIMQQKEKYNYGYKMGTARLRKQKILLPVNEENKPDYEYMEQYIKNLMFKKYKQYLDFKFNK